MLSARIGTKKPLFGKRNLLVTYHPVTLEKGTSREHFENLLAVLDELEEVGGDLDCENVYTLKSLKKLKPKKIILLGDDEVEGADVILRDLKPQTIQNEINKGWICQEY